MRVRQQSAPRQRADRAAMAPLLESQRRIDHRQPGPEDQQRRIFRRAAPQRFRPRTDVDRAFVRDAFMTAGQNSDFSTDRRPGGERDLDAARGYRQVTGLIPYDRQMPASLRGRKMFEHQAFEIAAVKTA